MLSLFFLLLKRGLRLGVGGFGGKRKEVLNRVCTLKEKEKRAEMALVCFLICPYFILPGSRKDLRHCCPCGCRTALQTLSGGRTAGAAAVPCACALRLSQSRLLRAAMQDGQFATLAKSIYWKLMRHK